MARDAGFNPKVFRAALRREAFRWHAHNHKWTVPEGGPEHKQMLAVLATLKKR
jgi:hypothetical protein